MCLVDLKRRLSDFSYYWLILKACEKSPQINFAVINKSPGVVNCRYQLGKREEYKLSLLQEMQGELTAATLKSLTRVLCHEDYKVLRRHFRQVLVDSWTVALGSVCVSLFCAPFSSFLFSLLLRYCFSIPAMASRGPKQKWRLMPKRPTLLQKTPFSRRILVSKLTYTQLYKWVAKILWFWPIISQNQGNRVPVGQIKSTHIVYSSEGDIEYACHASVSVWVGVMTVTGLWLYVMERMEFINEELTRGRLVCSQHPVSKRKTLVEACQISLLQIRCYR